MKISYFVPALLMAALILQGCASTPTKRWAQAREALTVSQNILLAQVQAGRLSDEEIRASDALIQAARRGLQLAEAQLPAGGETFDDRLAIIEAALDRLLETLGQQEAAVP
jgi:hypothetical protein